MALLPWNDEEDKKDESGIQRIASVQSGWQPAASGANSAVATDDITTRANSGSTQTRQSYLLSDEKAQADQQRRVREAQEAEARRVAAAQAAQQQQVQQTQTQPTQTERNPIDDGLDAGKSWEQIAKENLMPVDAVKDYSQATRPNYGITPMEQPKQGFFNKVRDVFDANTESDKYRRYQSNIKNAGNPENFKPVTMEDPGNIATQMGSHMVSLGKGWSVGSDRQERANKANIERVNVLSEVIINAVKKLQDPTLTAEERARWEELYIKTSNEANYLAGRDARELTEQVQATDPTKGAVAMGVAGLDVLSGGMGGFTAKQLFNQGLKQTVKSQGRVIGANAGVNALSGAGAGYVDGQDLPGMLQSAALSGTLGTVADIGLGMTGAGAARVIGRGGDDVLEELIPARPTGRSDAPDAFTPVRDSGGLTPVNGNTAANRAVVPEIGDAPRIPDGNISFTPVGRNTPESLTPATRPELNQPAIDTPAPKVEAPAIEAPAPKVVEAPAVAEGAVAPIKAETAPVLPTEQVKALQDSVPGKSQAEEAVINQKLQELDPSTPSIKGGDFVDKSASLSKSDVKRLRKQYQKAYDVETNPARRRQISRALAKLNVDKSEGLVDKSRAGFSSEEPRTLVKNDGWESYRQTSIDRYEKYLRGVSSASHREGVQQSIEALKNSNPNEVYRINPSTGKTEVHPASELLGAFSKYIDDDVPPIVIGNVAEPGSMRRLPSNWAGADGTYTSQLSRLDYKTKNSVYHETMHHIDHFVRGYEGGNAKMIELKQLRDAITTEDMQKFKMKEARAGNKAEYVAHAMDGLLDGRIKAGELGESVMKYIKKFFGSVKEAFTSSNIAGRSYNKADVAEYVQRLDAIINEGKVPGQKPLTPGELKPVKGNLPPSMGGDAPTPAGKPKAKTPPKPKGFEKMMMKSGDPTGAKQRIAKALGLDKDGSSELAEILAESNINPKQAKKITDIYSEIEKIAEDNAMYQKQNRKNYVGKKDVDEDINKAKNRDTRREQRLQRQLESQLKKVARQGDMGERFTQMLENVTAGRLANMLSSTGGVSRNLMQEIGADFISLLKNPNKTYRGMTKNGKLLKNEGQRSIDGWRDTPTSLSEGYKYILGNTYKTAMTPVSAGQRARVGGMRTELTKWAMKEIEGRDLTSAQAESLSRTLSNHTEAMANTLAGVDNGMVSSKRAMKTLRAWKEFVKTGETSDLLEFENLVERQSTLASKMMKGIFEGDTKKGRVVNAMLSNVFPYVRTAWNLASTGTTRTLNPLSKSVLDEIRADQLGRGTNTANILKNKLVDYGLLTGAAMLVNDNIIVYNDGDEVDQPRGISIKIGDDKYVPVRATPIELPLAVTVAAARIAGDLAKGEPRSPSYYGKIVSGSLPYIDAFEQTTNTMDSVGSVIDGDDEGDGGYAAKSYGVNAAKSLVPWSNNGIEPQIDAIQGKSTDAKSTYDKNPANWLGNQLNKSYGRGDYLPVSRDAAGRARTVDNQGVVINKTINDESTAEFNDQVSNLVEYGRQNGLGKATKDMFNTFDNGKNNNFKTIQSTIWAVTGKEGNETKLQPKDELYDLSQQIRDGFYGGTGSDLLMIGDQNLYSDVSMPNSKGTKNSSKPINMQSITNAIAATDLPEEDREAMYEVSQANTELWNQFQAKEISYEQYDAQKTENEEIYTEILGSSESYQKMSDLMEELDGSGFFDEGGLGSTRSGQTYLWNALNTLLAEKGKTPAADYPKDDKGWNSWGKGGGGSGLGAINKPGDRGSQGIQWSPVQARKMAQVKKGTYTPFKATVKLGNEVKKDKTQNYASRSF